MPEFGRFAEFLRSASFVQTALWGGLGGLSLLLLIVLRKSWRRFSPLHKCTVFSVWFHVVLIIYATSVQIVGERPGPGNGDGRVAICLNLSAADETTAKPKLPQPPESPERRTPADPTIPRTLSLATNRPPPFFAKLPPEPKTTPRSNKLPATTPRPAKAGSTTATATATTNPPQLRQTPTTQLSAAAKTAINDALVKWSKPSTPTVRSAALALPSLAAPPPKTTLTEAVAAPPVAMNMGTLTPITSPTTPTALPPAAATTAPLKLEAHDLPPIYQQRTAADRERIAALHGGSRETEEAVRRALRWLAANQETDGRWDAGRFGAGRETQTLGQNRGGAGAKADTGITGLALLALLGAGHTHQRGDYQTTVGHALDFLAASQHVDGSLGGNAEPFAFMYCHGMATLALSEALAMTNDARLRPLVERAINYTLRSQNRTTGGWRYRPGETGDMSQLGWQMMSLKSAELAGMEFPDETRRGIERFTASVSSGPGGGLASYRPHEQVSRPMTAEALVCRQFLGTPRQSPALDEAGTYLLGELPGAAQTNFYYWYYGTLGMYQLQGEHWRRWNDALTRQLLGSQLGDGESAGSWDPNDVWGGYGGRVYSTALATLCLEVYYRYLPLYVEAAANGGAGTRK